MDFRNLPGSEKDPIPTVNAAADFLSLPDPPPPPGSVSSSSIPSSPDSSSSSPSLPDSSPPESSSFSSSSWAKSQQVLMVFTILETVDEDVDYVFVRPENWLD